MAGKERLYLFDTTLRDGAQTAGIEFSLEDKMAVVRLLETGEYQQRARELGRRLADGLGTLVGTGVVSVRARGLWAGVDIDPALGTGRQVCEALMARGVLAKDTHGSTIRLAPPLVVTPDDVDLAVDALHTALGDLAR